MKKKAQFNGGMIAPMLARSAGRAPYYEDPSDGPDLSTMGGSATARFVGPTVGTLEHAILTDMRISDAEKSFALRRMMLDLGNPSSGTPLSSGMLSRLGGGALGMIVARLLGTGNIGMAVGGLMGFGLGKMIVDFYTGGGQSGPHSMR